MCYNVKSSEKEKEYAKFKMVIFGFGNIDVGVRSVPGERLPVEQ